MHLTVSTAMKFPPFFFLLSMVAIDLWKIHLSVCNIRLGKSHFSSARLYLISQQPLSLIGMSKCLPECLWKASRLPCRLCSVIFCTHCNGVSGFRHTHADCASTQGQNYTNNHKSNMHLVRQAHLLAKIADDALCTWFNALHVPPSGFPCAQLFVFLDPYVAVSHHLPQQHS